MKQIAILLIFCMAVSVMAQGPAPNSGDGIPDGSGMDGMLQDGSMEGDPQGPAPNSGDGVPDGSGMEDDVEPMLVSADASGPAPNSGDGVPDGSGMEGKAQSGENAGDSKGPAPNSGDGVPDGSGMESGPVETEVAVSTTEASGMAATQTRVKSGEYTTDEGKRLTVMEESNNMLQLKTGEATAETSMQMTQEGTRIQAKLNTGENVDVNVMPDEAQQKAMQKLQIQECSEENGCQIELKQVGEGEEAQAAYEIQVKKEARFLGIFKTQMQVKTQVSAEDGEILDTDKPWWAFLASE